MKPEGRLVELIEITNGAKLFKLKKYKKEYYKNVSIPKQMDYGEGDMLFTEIDKAGDRVFVDKRLPCDICNTGMFACDSEYICPFCDSRKKYEEI